MTYVRDTRKWMPQRNTACGVMRWDRIVLIAFVGLVVAGPVAASDVAPASDSAAIALAVVNGDTITTSDLDRLLIKTHQDMSSVQRKEFDYEQLLTRLVNDRLLAQEAVAMGMDMDPELVADLDDMRKTRATRLWIRDNFKPETEVPEDSVLVYFRDNFNRVQVRLIATRSHAEAAAVRDAILNGASMDSIAQVVSLDKHKVNGGLRRASWHVETEPVLRDLSDTIDVGVLSDVFPYRSVYAVARIEANTPADTAELHMVRPQIETWLNRLANEQKWAVFSQALKERYPAVDNDAVLQRIRSDSMTLFTQDFSQGTDEPAITIDNRIAITDQEFRSELAHSAMTDGTVPFPDLYRTTYDKLVEDAVLIAAAYAEGYDTLPALVSFLRRAKDSALVEMYIEETVTPRITFSHREFDEYKQMHPEEFREPDDVQFDEMAVDSQDVAMEIYQRLREGADFSYLVRQYNARTRNIETTPKFMKVSAFPEDMRRELDTLSVGDCLKPRLTEEGWVILRLKARREGAPLSIEEMETHLRAVMFQQKFNEELDSVLSILKEHSTIEYNETAIQSYFGKDS